MGFNPSSPDTLGLEWPVVRRSYTQVSNAAPIIMGITASANETIGALRTYVTVPGFSLYSPQFVGAKLVCDVYTSPPNSREDLTVDEVAPDTTEATAGWTAGSPVTTEANWYQNIDEYASGSIDYDDYIYKGAEQGQLSYLGFCQTDTLTLTNKRIESLGVRIIWFAERDVGNFWPYINIDSIGYNADIYATSNMASRFSTSIDAAGSIITPKNTGARWYLNPSTGLPWTIAEIDDFSDTDTVGARSFVGIGPNEPAGGYWPGKLAFYAMKVDVRHRSETRVATGYVEPAASGWQNIPLLTPAGGAFSITSGTTYYYVLRVGYVPSGNPTFTVAGFDTLPLIDQDHQQVDLGFITPEKVTLAASSGFPQDQSTDTTISKRYAFVPRTTAPANATDVQPYVTLNNANVSTGNDVEQEITSPGVGTYGSMTAVVTPNDADADLSVSIHQRSDDAQVGSTVTITTAELTGNQYSPRYVTKLLDTPAALTGQQYYVRFTSSSTEVWSISFLDVEDSTYSDRTFGGTTDILTVDAISGDDSEADAIVMLHAAPAAPAGFGVTTQTAVLETLGSEQCAVSSIEYAELSWTTTSYGADFSAYEIERRDDTDTTWRRIARITTESQTTFHDYEGRRNVASDYRLRSIRTDTAKSDWTEIDNITPVSSGAELLFVSNEDSSYAVGYNDETPRTFTFADADRKRTYFLYGEDGRVSYQETENRGDEFTANLILAANPTTKGRTVFQAIIDISRAQLSYVCVLDSDGNRWFATIGVPEGVREEPGGLYTVPVLVEFLTEKPSSPPNPLT